MCRLLQRSIEHPLKQNIIPAEIAQGPAGALSPLTLLARHLLLTQLRKVRHGRLRLIDSGLNESFGSSSEAAPFDVTLRVRDPRSSTPRWCSREPSAPARRT